MEIKFIAILFFYFALGYPSVGYAQEWKQVSKDELKSIVDNIHNSNPSNGCYAFDYTTYNYSRKGQPVASLKAEQCVEDDVVVSYQEGVGLNYNDSNLSLHVDSSRSTLVVGFNAAYVERATNSRDAINELLEQSELITVAQEESNGIIINVLVPDQKGVEKYQIELDDQFVIQQLIIFYEEKEQVIYGKQNTYSKPIVEIAFNRIDESRLSTMTDLGYFLSEGKSGLVPSLNYQSYNVEDNRIVLD